MVGYIIVDIIMVGYIIIVGGIMVSYILVGDIIYGLLPQRRKLHVL